MRTFDRENIVQYRACQEVRVGREFSTFIHMMGMAGGLVARLTTVCLGVAVLVMLSSCSAAPESQGPPGPQPSSGQWVEPAWMAEVRKNNEELGSKIASCMADKGWVEERQSDGSYSVTLSTADDGPRYREDRGVCESLVRDDLGIPHRTLDDASFRTMYARTLDTRDCLVAHGVVVSEPPSEDAWIEAIKTGTDVWAPFNDVTGSDEEFYELFEVCVQAGVEITR